MKTCKLCGMTKSLEDFYELSKSRRHMGDGHDTRCKECAKNLLKSDEQKERNRIRDKERRNDPERIAYNKEYQEKYRNTEQGKESHRRAYKKYRKTEHGKEKSDEKARLFRLTENFKLAIERYRAKYPEKRKAQIILANAIADGRINRPNTCSVCEKLCTPEGHHYDYSKPLSVIWLCKKCHSAIHWA